MDLSRIEGYWGTSREDARFPWPVACSVPQQGQVRFLECLSAIEGAATLNPASPIRVRHAKGDSFCRLCGCANGNREFRTMDWTWPEGFRHYVEDHHVPPSPEFKAYITKSPACSGQEKA